MNDFDRIPSPGNLFWFQILIWIGIDAIIIKELSYEKWGYLYFYDTGELAVYGGILFVTIGLIPFYLYFRNIKNEVLILLKNKDILNSVYVIWLIFLISPIFSYELNFHRYLRITIIGTIGIVNFIFSTKYHLKIKNMILT